MSIQHANPNAMQQVPALPLNATARHLLLAAALLLVPLAASAQQTTFATPDAAVDALTRALSANDEPALVQLFGEKYREVVATGDGAHDAARRSEAAAALASRRRLEELGADRRILRMGAYDWPFSIPLVRDGAGWRFATEQGVEELLNRRIGANERNAIYVLRAYVDAQREYATRDRNGDGVLEYARRLASSPGRQDGLYWAADAAKGEEESPMGPLVAAAAKELSGHRAGEPYSGYHFRILTSQGPSAPGGAHSYIVNGRMIAGFAAVATPATWGRTGVMTFVVSHNGKLYQRNLGPNPAAVTRFDPGQGWTEVEDLH